MKFKKTALLIVILVMIMAVVGCSKTGTSNESVTDEGSVSTTAPTTDEATTVPPVTAATEESSETPTEPTQEITEAPTTEYVGAWTLLSSAKLNPTQSGYEELDSLINNLLSQIITEDMNGYKKAWACYEYLVDNIVYSRGMDANTGMYSESDPATTPTEVLWATDLLNSGMGCCYHYSAAYMYILRAIGFEAHLVSGNVPAYGGGETPHCWLFVTIDGVNYIFDPDLDMNYYKRDINNGVENPPKDRFFCVPSEKISYFYRPVTYYTN
jgi:transglutaminase-like putative cysteine protease